MGRSRSGAARTVAVVATLLFVAAACGHAQTTRTFTGPQTSPAAIAGSLPSTPLTTEQRTEALSIVHADATAGRLLARSSFRLVGTDQWGDAATWRGAALTFATAKPISVDADLPQADVPPDAPTKGQCERPYRQTWLHETAAHVTKLEILVDLGRRRVADITTNASSGTLAWVPGKPHPDCEEIPSG